jgi:hypothetical protein
MDDLLRFTIAHFSYLYNELGFRFIDSSVQGTNAALVLENQDLRIRLIRDRDQVFVDFQGQQENPKKKWYSFGVVRQLLSGQIGSEEIDADKARFIREHFRRIEVLFSSASRAETERLLQGIERDRAKRLFG